MRYRYEYIYVSQISTLEKNEKTASVLLTFIFLTIPNILEFREKLV